MNKPPPVPAADTPKQNPAREDNLKNDGIQKDGYDLPIEGVKTDSTKPQKVGVQDVKNALGSG